MQFFQENYKPKLAKKTDYAVLHKALDATMSVCVCSSSALLINPLSEQIDAARMLQYQQHSTAAINHISMLHNFLHKISSYMKKQDLLFFDAKEAIKRLMSQAMAGNCEHQAFYLASLLKQQNIPAFIYNIEDIEHTIVITENFLIDPWMGKIFNLATDLIVFYHSNLVMTASWLNQLLSNRPVVYPSTLNADTLMEHFATKAEHTSIKTL